MARHYSMLLFVLFSAVLVATSAAGATDPEMHHTIVSQAAPASFSDFSAGSAHAQTDAPGPQNGGMEHSVFESVPDGVESRYDPVHL